MPDLDIPARASKKAIPAAKPAAPAPPPAARPAPPPAAQAHLNDLGTRSFEDEDADGQKIDLDLSGPALIKTGDAPEKVEKKKEPEKPAAPKGPAPIDLVEARALADYGDAPEAAWRTPLYAYRVLRRRPELKKLVTAKKREADRAEGAAEDALFAFAEQVRPTAERLAGFARALEDVRATEQVLRERDAVLMSEADAHKQKQAQHDARIAELDAQLSQIQIEERAIAGELNEAELLLKRADARVKRVEIEIRNALAEAGLAPAPDAKGVGP